MSVLSKLPAVKKNTAKRIGRGYGSGVGGHTSTRGGKGHTARTGGSTPLWFEGGQLPLIRRLPWWRGKSRFQSLRVVQEVQLREVMTKGLTTVTPETLVKAGMAQLDAGEIRLIGAQKIEVALTVQGVAVSGPVRQAIEAAGGSVTL